MNVSLNWLRALAPSIEAGPDEVSDRLAGLGFPVEGREQVGEALADIVVARVVEANPHPNADRLRLCKVDAGSGELLDVVCGAPNARAGGTFPFIPVGATLPGGMKIRKAKIRGEHSFGMLCSARELGLGHDHDGLLELAGDLEPGTSFIDAWSLRGETVLDVEVTSNRGDMLSHVGIARELAPSGDADVELPPIPGVADLPQVTWVEGTSEAEFGGLRVAIDAPQHCSRFTGAIIEGVEVGPSPAWLQARLRAIGARPINNVVDATNYVLFELGQPTHAYDLDQLRGGTIRARLAQADEPVTTLDGEERSLATDMLVIADAERVVNVAGIMGDDSSSVSAETTRIFIECAAFEPASIRRTKKALAIQSDAGYRFERGVDPAGQREALARVVELVLATAGGTVRPEWFDVAATPWSAPTISLRPARIAHLLGVEFSPAEAAGLLEPLGFDVASGADALLEVRVPGWRSFDVRREVDLIEEIARRHGYEQFPETLQPHRPNTVPDHPLFQLEDDLRGALVARGFFEAQTPAFVSRAEGEVELANPLSQEEPVLRRTLLPSLLRRVERNLARGVRDVRLFEIGTSFRAGPAGEAPVERTHLALAFTGRRRPMHWASDDAPFDIWDLKSLLEFVADLVQPGCEVAVGAPVEGRFLAQLGFTVRLEGASVGAGGVVAPKSLDVPAWAGDVLALELELPVVPVVPEAPVYRSLPAHPAMERDLALLVPTGTAASEVEGVARAAAGELLEALQAFDLYEGKGLPEGTRSIGWRFRFRAPDRTLTDEEVDPIMRRIQKRLDDELGVRRRD